MLRKQGILILGLLLVILLQACGTENRTAAGSSSNTASNAGSGKTASNVPKELRIGYITANPLNLPGEAEGWGFYKSIINDGLKAYGITNISFVSFPSGPDLNESLIGGRLDMGILGDTPSIAARATGAKTKLIGQPTTSTNIYLLTKSSGPKTFNDLKGTTVATQKGSILHRYAVGILKQNGLSDSVKLIHIPSTDIEAALARGDVAAATASGANAIKLASTGYAILDEAAKTPSLLGTSTTVVSEDYLQKFPDFPKVFNELRSKALADLKTKPDEYYEFLSKASNTTVDIAKRILPLEQIPAEPFSDSGLKQLEDTKQFLLEQKLIDSDFTIADWIAK